MVLAERWVCHCCDRIVSNTGTTAFGQLIGLWRPPEGPKPPLGATTPATSFCNERYRSHSASDRLRADDCMGVAENLANLWENTGLDGLGLEAVPEMHERAQEGESAAR